MVADRSPVGQQTVAEIRASDGLAEFVQTDVSRAEDVTRLVDNAVDSDGQLDILVNCAAIPLVMGLVSTTEQGWDQLMSINLKGTFLCIKAVVPARERRGSGAIVNTASTLALKG